MKKLGVIAALLMAGAAYGVSMGAGGFGGIAMPVGSMADDLKMSPTFGGKALFNVKPWLDLEVAFAYNLNHPPSEWQSDANLSEPETTIIPITAGANYKKMFGNVGFYVGLGAGYYMKMEGLGGVIETHALEVVYDEEVDVNAPGTYFGGGFLYKFGDFALDVSPRFTYVMNEETFEINASVNGNTVKLEIPTPNDTYFNLVAGVNYYFM